MAENVEDQKKKKKVPVWVWIVAGVVILGAAISSGGESEESAPETTASAPQVEDEAESSADSSEPAEEASQSESDSSAEVAEPAAVSGIEDGTYFVGDEIEPGTYRSVGGAFCYWERLSGFGGSFDEIISNGSGPLEIAEISETDEGFSSSGCGTWVPVEETFPDAPADTISDGVHVVGSHIQPGTYKAEITDGCYWDRLSGFGGTFGEIIANGFEDSVVTIDASDVGFASDGCGTWTLRG